MEALVLMSAVPVTAEEATQAGQGLGSLAQQKLLPEVHPVKDKRRSTVTLLFSTLL